MARAKKAAAPPDPAKLIREEAGAYRTGDRRFTVESQASGTWFVVDSEQLDELGMARVLGPYATLDDAKAAIEQARSSPPVSSLLKARAQRGVKATAQTTRRANDDEERAKPAPKAPPKPKPPRIRYTTSTQGIRPSELRGFFVGWPDPPSPETHRRLLAGSDEVVLAIDDEAGRVVGFITALTDRVLSAYVPLLEVLPEYQKEGIAKELMERLLAKLGSLYMIDLVTDTELQSFYERFGFKKSVAMSIRSRRKAG